MLRLGVFAFLVVSALGCGSSEVSRALGAQCESRSDCDERCLRGNDFPDGMCTTSCETDSDCPLPARCIDEEGGVCMYTCEVSADCEFLGTGWDCEDKDAREASLGEVTVCYGR